MGDNSNINEANDNRLESLFGEEDDGQGGNNFEQQSSPEVEQRLDDFFREDDDVPAAPAVRTEKKQNGGDTVNNGSTLKAENSELKDLKSVVLSVEWEISDQVMQRLGEEISKLETTYKDDKIATAFLQLLSSLGKYIQKKKADSHPDSISLLNSVYENFEKTVLSPDMNEMSKKKMLVAEVAKYKKLKEHIAAAKPRVAEKPIVAEPIPEEASAVSESSAPEYETSGETDQAGSADMANSQDVIHILREINNTIKAEFKALKEEIRQLKENS